MNAHRIGTDKNPFVHLSRRPKADGWIIIPIIVLQMLLALMMRLYPPLSMVHALVTLTVGLLWAISSNGRRLNWVVAYIIGSEVLWRMTGANIFWEFAKYAVILILGIGWLRRRAKISVALPIIYFFLLVPSAFITLQELGFSDVARQEISFNLSGPLALMVCVLFFSSQGLSPEDFRRTAWGAVLPITGIAALILQGIITAEVITFTNESNFATSGGFGPNQVSAVLGFAATLLFLILMSERNRFLRWFCFGLALAFLTLGALTFSRGGLYNAAVAILLAAAHFLRSSRSRGFMIVLLVAGGLVGGYWIYPQLNNITSGKITERFSDYDTTGRSKILRYEIEAGLEAPVWGVGPGMAKYYVFTKTGVLIAAHTEYTRMLGEHGILGGIALLLLGAMAWSAYRRSPHWMAQAWTIALLAWPLMEMTHSAMRLGAISFAFGLAFTRWRKVPNPNDRIIHEDSPNR